MTLFKALTALLISLSACASSTLSRNKTQEQPCQMLTGKPVILAIMPQRSSDAIDSYDGLRAELGDQFDVIPQPVDANTTAYTFHQWNRLYRPHALVLMSDKVLNLFRRYQSTLKKGEHPLPAVAILASYLPQSSHGLHNLTGIIYEVPLVTSLIHLRALTPKPLHKVGVLFRNEYRSFLEEQEQLSAKEGFQLISLEVEGSTSIEIRNGLEQLHYEHEVDAFWVLNDTELLQRKKLLRGWLPSLEAHQLPVIVNARSLVSKDVHFGTYAALPNHRALGGQAGQLIYSIASQDWSVRSHNQFEYPISIEEVLHVRLAEQQLPLLGTQMKEIDQLVR